MRRAVLDDSLRLLLHTCATAALLVTPACADKSGVGAELGEDDSGCPGGGGWEPAVDVELAATGTIVEMTRIDNELVVLMSEGTLVDLSSGAETSESIPATGLRAWVEPPTSARVVVGDGGQILRRNDAAFEWDVIDAGITDDLIDIVAASDGTWMLAIASNRVFYTSDEDLLIWTEIPAPEGSWSGLRRVFAGLGVYWLIGEGGQVWTSADPSTGWEPFELGTNADLIDGDSHCNECLVIASADALHLVDSETSLPAPEGESFIAVADGYAVSDRAVYSISISGPSLTKIEELDFTPTAVAGDDENVFVAGATGELVRLSLFYCIGRPWLIASAPTTASLPGLARTEGWARDGLYEHASVASFARFVSELLALAAPPALIQAAQVAIPDELEHARLCFEQAAREHGPLQQPGPLPLDPHGTARAGDPVALALAVFEEGCLGETIAAIEAGVAAAAQQDPDARRALERIAADERRHAALAWRTLRWLLDEFGAPVRAALRRRLLTLGARGNELRVRTIAEVTRPLMLALLSTDAIASRC